MLVYQQNTHAHTLTHIARFTSKTHTHTHTRAHTHTYTHVYTPSHQQKADTHTGALYRSHGLPFTPLHLGERKLHKNCKNCTKNAQTAQEMQKLHKKCTDGTKNAQTAQKMHRRHQKCTNGTFSSSQIIIHTRESHKGGVAVHVRPVPGNEAGANLFTALAHTDTHTTYTRGA